MNLLFRVTVPLAIDCNTSQSSRDFHDSMLIILRMVDFIAIFLQNEQLLQCIESTVPYTNSSHFSHVYS